MSQMNMSPRLVRPLSDIDVTDLADVGGKAATLGALLRAGFPVPDGFVLTAGTGAPTARDIAQVMSSAQDLGPVAVRSSGVAEDGAVRSYAGQFDTVLNVDGAVELSAALRACAASAGGDRIRGYAGAGDQPLAILVQRMVSADAAGVAFTANPVTGEKEVLVNAVRGLGDQLVAGAVDADEWVVSEGSARRIRGAGGAVSADQVKQVAKLADRVAAHFGAPQDIEWAIADGELFLLQARPITALPVPVPVDPPPGFWERDATHAPRPLSPLMASVFRFNECLHRMAEEFGLLATPTAVEIGGWPYVGMVPVGAPPGRPAPPAWLLALLVRVVPVMRRRVRRCRSAVRTDLPVQMVKRWYAQWRPELAERIQALREAKLSALDDAGLRRHLTATDRLFADSLQIHFWVDFGSMLAVGEFGLACQELLGWDDARVFELCAGLSTTSTEPAHRLAEVARLAADRPALRDALDRAGADLMGFDMRSVDPVFTVAFDGYQNDYGCRALHYDVLQPTILETPELTLGLLRDQLARGYDVQAEQRGLAARRAAAEATARATVPAGHRDRFDRLLARAQRAYPAREDNEFFTFSVPLALIRLAALEAGRRLAGRALLDATDDVFFLTLDEITSALGDGTDVRDTARRRRGERAWVLAHPGPASYGRDPGPPPAMAGFPPEVRHTARVFAWLLDRMLDRPEGAHPDGELSGVPGSPGRYRGPVRVILDESEFGKLRAGDVLVCRTTSPVWSVLFPSLGAIVTDAGGSLSHPAIIAREYRVPAVVSTGSGTQLLRDGQIVTVDGSAGTVEVHP